MIRLTFLIFILFFLSNCSFSEKSRIWNDKEEKIENQNIKKLFAKEEKKITEFNPDLKLDLSKLKFNNSTLYNQNNFLIFLLLSRFFSLLFQISNFSLDEQ